MFTIEMKYRILNCLNRLRIITWRNGMFGSAARILLQQSHRRQMRSNVDSRKRQRVAGWWKWFLSIFIWSFVWSFKKIRFEI